MVQANGVIYRQTSATALSTKLLNRRATPMDITVLSLLLESRSTFSQLQDVKEELTVDVVSNHHKRLQHILILHLGAEVASTWGDFDTRYGS